MNHLLQVHQLTKTYGKKKKNEFTALQNVTFSVGKGEFVGIMGPSGSGKTTLLNILSTLDQPTGGEVVIDSTNLSAMNEDQLSDFRAQHLGFIFQDFNLLDNLTVFENISLPLSLQDVPPKEIEERVKTIAEKLDIAHILTHYPTEISGGQKQRTAIGRALIHEPKLILGDEPTGALDSKNAKNLLKTLSQLNEEQQISIVMVTHDPKSASFCHRVLFIQDGQIQKEVTRTGQQDVFYKEILHHVATMEEGE